MLAGKRSDVRVQYNVFAASIRIGHPRALTPLKRKALSHARGVLFVRFMMSLFLRSVLSGQVAIRPSHAGTFTPPMQEHTCRI
jgi:hypothetical protein